MRNSLPFIVSAAAVLALVASLAVAIAGVDDSNGVDGAGGNSPLVLAPARPVAPPAPPAQPPSSRVVEPEAAPRAPAPPRETESRQSPSPEPTPERSPEPTPDQDPEPITEQSSEPTAEQDAEHRPEPNAEQNLDPNTKRRTPEPATEDDEPRQRPPAPDRDQMQREVGRSMCGQWGFPEERCNAAIRRQQQYR